MGTTSEQPQKEVLQHNEKESKLKQTIKRQITFSRALLVVFFIIVITLLSFQPRTLQNTAPDFTLDNINGEQVVLSEYRGEVVLLEFMATWCPVCREETTELLKLSQRYRNQVIIITISTDPNYDTVNWLNAYVEAHGISWSVCRDTQDVNQTYEIDAIPSLVLIDQHQNISWRNTGWANSDTLSEQIAQLL